uniref:Uncharacterized protein n=1 Tax=Zea mays TaxID=4577 RepID=Q36274_MAIZE|nr:unknown protein [Zea mays]
MVEPTISSVGRLNLLACPSPLSFRSYLPSSPISGRRLGRGPKTKQVIQYLYL